MENETLNDLQLTKLTETIQRYKEDLEILFKEKVTSKQIDSNSDIIKEFSVDVTYNGFTAIVQVNLVDYFKYVEEGRGPGKMPPVINILEWVKKKNILPRPLGNGMLPTQESLAYAISKHISENGIEGKHILQETLTELNARYESLFQSALQEDFNNYSNILLEKLNNIFKK